MQPHQHAAAWPDYLQQVPNAAGQQKPSMLIMTAVRADLCCKALQLQTALLLSSFVSVQLHLEALQALHPPLPAGHARQPLLQAAAVLPN